MEEREFDHGWGRSPRLLLKQYARLKLNQYDNQIVRAIEYFTIGWSKYSETISISQLVEITGIDKRHMNERLRGLIKRGVIEVKKGKYRLLFDVVTCRGDSNKEEKIKVTWTGKEYTHRGDESHSQRTESHSQRRTPKTPSEDSLINSPKKKEIYSKFTEEEIEKNKRKALAIADELKKKYEQQS